MRRSRATRALAGTLALVVALAGCGGGDDQGDDGPSVSNPPEVELAALLNSQGSLRHRLDAEDVARFATVLLAHWGLDAEDRACLAPAVEEVLQADEEGRVSLARMGRLAERLGGGSEFATKVEACTSEDSRARREAEESAPDLDLTGFDELARRTAEGQALALGFTPEEAACYARTVFEDVDIERFSRALVRLEDGQGFDPVGAVKACVEQRRRSQLVVAGRRLVEEYEACRQQQAEEQAAAITEALSASTVPGATTAPTTTFPPCA